MTGVYLRCDSCGATLGGEQVTDVTNGVHWSRRGILQQAARERGWTGELEFNSEDDKCPECSAKFNVPVA